MDAVLLETCSEPEVCEAIRVAVQDYPEPILLSLAYRRDSRNGFETYSHHPPEWFAERAQQCGLAALGVNCGRDIGMAESAAIVRRYRQHTDLPLFARPNAGSPTREGERWIYPLSPRDMAEGLPELLEAGVAMNAMKSSSSLEVGQGAAVEPVGGPG